MVYHVHEVSVKPQVENFRQRSLRNSGRDHLAIKLCNKNNSNFITNPLQRCCFSNTLPKILSRETKLVAGNKLWPLPCLCSVHQKIQRHIQEFAIFQKLPYINFIPVLSAAEKDVKFSGTGEMHRPTVLCSPSKAIQFPLQVYAISL